LFFNNFKEKKKKALLWREEKWKTLRLGRKTTQNPGKRNNLRTGREGGVETPYDFYLNEGKKEGGSLTPLSTNRVQRKA